MTTTETTNQAINQVRDNNLEYYENLFLFAQEWFKTQFKGVTSEDLKTAYYALKNDEPREPKVFGAVFRKLSNSGLIFKHGFKLSKNPKCHSRPIQIWISKEYRLTQQRNRKTVYPELGLFN